MKGYLILIICTLIAMTPIAQNTDNFTDLNNELNFEALGSTTLYSVNYERRVYQIENWEAKLKGGAMFWPFRIPGTFDHRLLSIQGEFKILYNMGRNAIELGIGYTWIYYFNSYYHNPPLAYDYNRDINLGVPRLGYRRYFKNHDKYIGVAFTPLIILDLYEPGERIYNNRVIPFGGLTYGFLF